MDIGVDLGQPNKDFITLYDGSNRYRDPVTGTFMIDRFDLSFDQYRDRRRFNMNKRAFGEADKLQQLRNRNRPPLTSQTPAPAYNYSSTTLTLGCLLILVSLVILDR